MEVPMEITIPGKECGTRRYSLMVNMVVLGWSLDLKSKRSFPTLPIRWSAFYFNTLQLLSEPILDFKNFSEVLSVCCHFSWICFTSSTLSIHKRFSLPGLFSSLSFPVFWHFRLNIMTIVSDVYFLSYIFSYLISTVQSSFVTQVFIHCSFSIFVDLPVSQDIIHVFSIILLFSTGIYRQTYRAI